MAIFWTSGHHATYVANIIRAKRKMKARKILSSIFALTLTIAPHLVIADDVGRSPTAEALEHAVKVAHPSNYMLTLTEFYLYKGEQGSVKDVLHTDGYDARMEALTNVMLSFQKSDFAKYVPANGTLVAKYATLGIGQMMLTKDEVMKAGFKDIVSGNYRSAKAIIVLEAYRHFLAANLSGLLVDQPPTKGNDLILLNIQACNLAWFLQAVTKPIGEENVCGGSEVSQYAKEIQLLSPTLSDTQLPFSKSLADNLANYARFKYHYNPDLDGSSSTIQMHAYSNIMVNLGSSEELMHRAIQRDGGIDNWRDLSALDGQIASTDAALGSQSSVTELRAMQEKKVQLCRKRNDQFPSAKPNKLCAN